MLACGTYDSAGDCAYRVGLPAKSGVGAPPWGPPADSAAGLAALDAFTTYSDWTVF